MELSICKNIDVVEFLTIDTLKTTIKWRCPEFLVNMLEEGVHADITFEAKGGCVKAHRSVLASLSPVFAAMFRHDMKEQLTSTVHIPDMSIDALQLFLLVLYTTIGNNDVGTPQLNAAIDKNFKEFHEAVMIYQVERRLESVHISALYRNLNSDNCWIYYIEFLTSGNLKMEAMICQNYILSNYANLIGTKSFLVAMRSNPVEVCKVINLAEDHSLRKLSHRIYKVGEESYVEVCKVIKLAEDHNLRKLSHN